MNDFLIFLHLISFVTGIVLMTLVYYFYSKNNNKIAKQVFLADIFYTAFLLTDTLDLYFRKELINYPSILHNSLMILLFIAGVLSLCFLLHIICHITNIRLSNVKVRVFFLFLALIFISGFVLGLLNALSLTLNIILVLVVFLIFGKAGSIKKEFRSWVLACSVIILASMIYLFIINVFNNLPSFFYKVPTYPVTYFFLNAAGILFIKRHLFGQDNTSDVSLKTEESNNSQAVYNFERLSVLYGISERESEITRLIVDGLSNQDIAKKLFISPNTVKNHIYNIYRKIGIKNRYELMSLLAKTESASNQAKN